MNSTTMVVAVVFLFLIPVAESVGVCSTLLAHGNDDPLVPNSQSAYILQPKLMNDQAWWAQAHGSGTISVASYNKMLWLLNVGSDYMARGKAAVGELFPYEISTVWSVYMSASKYTAVELPEFRIECDETPGSFWRMDGVCEDEDLYIDHLVDRGSLVSQSDCLQKCLNEPSCTAFSISRYGCFPATKLCTKRVSLPAGGFTYTTGLSSEVQLNRSVYQSSVDEAWEGYPEKAIDGDLRPNLIGGFAQTQKEANPWWVVDLGATYQIEGVVITNRMDCCSDRLIDTLISVALDTSATQVIQTLESGDRGTHLLARCSQVLEQGPRVREVYYCRIPLLGQVVVLHKDSLPGRTDVLQFCEVEVLAQPGSRYKVLEFPPPGGVQESDIDLLCNTTFLWGWPLELDDPDSERLALEEVGEGDVWVSQSGVGADRYKDTSITGVQKSDIDFLCNTTFLWGWPLELDDPDSERLALEEVGEGDVWVSQSGVGADRYNDTSITGRLLNVALQTLGSTCSSSPSRGDGPCTKSQDGVPASGWFMNLPAVGAYLQIDFAFTYLVHRIVILQPPKGDGGFRDVTFHFSDGSMLNVTLKPRESSEGTREWDDIPLSQPHNTTWVKLVINSVYGSKGYGVMELQVFGETGLGLEPHDGQCEGNSVVKSIRGALSECQHACFNHENCSSLTHYFKGDRASECDLLNEPCTSFKSDANALTLNVIADSPTQGFYVIDGECSNRYYYISTFPDVTVAECAARCRAYTACFLFIYCLAEGGTCSPGTCYPMTEFCSEPLAKRGPEVEIFILKESAHQRMPTYIGCSENSEIDATSFYHLSTEVSIYGNSPRTCREYCLDKGFKFAAISTGRCACCNVIKTKSLHNALGYNNHFDKCRTQCKEDPDQNCGYYSAFAFYSTAPEVQRDCIFLTTDDYIAGGRWRLVESVCELSLQKVICERPYDYCSGRPCHGNGVCEGQQNGYVCTCSPGFTGIQCDIYIDECLNHKCKHGNCVDEHLTYRCNCSHGYTGQLCQTEINECDLVPCLNNATCQDQLGTYECACPPGYTGSHCETELEECESDPCDNGGRCIDEVDGFSCFCPAGYIGVSCENETNECESSPCQYNATCRDKVARYECDCEPGYSGDHCQIENDECSSSPCLNNSTCEDRLNYFTCLCPKGFQGTFCENNIDDCVGFPCENNGICQDGVDGYSCDCLAGFEGSSCELYGGNPGNWAAWSDWSSCTVTCGWGSQSRSRDCDAMFPELGEGHCSPGVATEDRKCELLTCPPVDGAWGPWFPATPCSALCGLGVLEVRRRCDSPSPQNGGKTCENGPNVGSRICSAKPCQATQHCSSWSSWGLCSTTCGWGQQTRFRQCPEDAMINQTKIDVETQECHLDTCGGTGSMCNICEATYTAETLMLGGCEEQTTCPRDKPFCSYIFTKEGSNQFKLQKGCASQKTCDTALQSSRSQPCMDLFQTAHTKNIEENTFSANLARDDVIRSWRDVSSSCTMCCTGDFCNQGLLPQTINAYGKE